MDEGSAFLFLSEPARLPLLGRTSLLQVTYAQFVQERCSAEEPFEVLCEDRPDALQVKRASRRPGNVRGHDHIGHLPERMVRRHRIVIVRVERRSSDPALTQGTQQRLFFYEGPARGIEQ